MSESRPPGRQTDTERVVDAIRRLVVFVADQAGAYRELFGPVAEQLGDGISTRLTCWLSDLAASGAPGVVILTGNAGTGKTAATEAFCRALGGSLPDSDDLTVVSGALVAKDISGLPSRSARAEVFRRVLRLPADGRALLCANEGVLRDAAEDLVGDIPNLGADLDVALRAGISRRGQLTVVNVNRQRITSAELWDRLLDFLTAADLWAGCSGCPAEQVSVGCPMRANAESLRQPNVRASLRLLVQIASGETVPTMRELLSVLAYAICGDSSGDSGDDGMWTCDHVRRRALDRGERAFTASSAYFNLLFGAGLPADIRERSPLLSALERLGAGVTADLEVDDWLRDSGRGRAEVGALAGAPSSLNPPWPEQTLAGSRSPLDRVRTSAGEFTFHGLGELISISEDEDKVRAGVHALVHADLPALHMWRRRLLFEGGSSLGGAPSAVARLTSLRHAPELVALARRVATGSDVVTDVKELIKGLNFLVAGFADASEGLMIPEPASLFARNPGSFRAARPAFIHAKVPAEQVTLEVPDGSDVAEVLDIDHAEVRLVVHGEVASSLTISPRVYQAIREAELFRGPVGQGTAEMTDLRSFYGRLAEAVEREPGMQVADPRREALVRVQLPHFSSHA